MRAMVVSLMNAVNDPIELTKPCLGARRQKCARTQDLRPPLLIYRCRTSDIGVSPGSYRALTPVIDRFIDVRLRYKNLPIYSTIL